MWVGGSVRFHLSQPTTTNMFATPRTFAKRWLVVYALAQMTLERVSHGRRPRIVLFGGDEGRAVTIAKKAQHKMMGTSGYHTVTSDNPTILHVGRKSASHTGEIGSGNPMRRDIGGFPSSILMRPCLSHAKIMCIALCCCGVSIL